VHGSLRRFSDFSGPAAEFPVQGIQVNPEMEIKSVSEAGALGRQIITSGFCAGLDEPGNEKLPPPIVPIEVAADGGPVFKADERVGLCRAADCASTVTGRARYMEPRIAAAATYRFTVAPPMSLRTTDATRDRPCRLARSACQPAALSG
jgi:hypothetical protein